MPSALSLDYRQLGQRLAERLGRPQLAGIHLPAAVQDETFRDEFGFVFLDDGSIGPFYVSLDELLPELWRRHPEPAQLRGDAHALIDGFAATDPAARALALGCYNALSAALYRRAGFTPPGRVRSNGQAFAAGTRVGMVGYFCPVVERLLEQGCEVLVLEKAPQRVALRSGVSVTTGMAALRDCAHVLCTASTLLNDSLEEILDEIGGHTGLDLIGPSGSGLPDPLFARGVRSVGGVGFSDRAALLERLASGESWGSIGRKYELDGGSYPGVDVLLARSGDGGADADEA